MKKKQKIKAWLISDTESSSAQALGSIEKTKQSETRYAQTFNTSNLKLKMSIKIKSAHL